jgi:predicted RNA binding protein YcfA (HicA-like mRNA interferase family)
MKLPRDLDGPRLVKTLSVLGYVETRQSGSHIRITTQRDGENHEIIPRHHAIKTGTLSSILKRIAAHHRISLDELLEQFHHSCTQLRVSRNQACAFSADIS